MTALSENTPATSQAEAPRASRDEIVARLARENQRRQRLAGPRAVGMTVASIAVLFAVWELVVAAGWAPSYALPSPVSVVHVFFTQFPTLVSAAWPTLQEILVGFGLTVAVFIPLGVLIASSRWLEGLVNPLLVISQATPMIAIAPLLITWGGFGIMPKIIMVMLISFFPVVVNTVAGLKSAAPEVVDLGRSMGASRLAMLFRIRLPGALPSIFAGLRVAITLSVIGAIVGEFAGTNAGLGLVIVDASGRLNAPLVFAAVIALAVIGLVLYKLVESIERLAIPWRRDRRDRPAR
jgi:NitT/TauT family transport system permease protein